MSTPRTDAKDASLKGETFAMCYGVMVEFARTLEIELVAAQSDAATNAAMLAKQCDLARDAETRAMQAER